MAQNTVAANLLMVMVFLGGIIGLYRVKQEVFPEFELDMISVSVIYPGASPQDIEQGIVLAVEEAVVGVDGVKRVTSKAVEGTGVVNAELLLTADSDRVLADMKTAVDRIRTFPEEAEEPNISLATRTPSVVTMVIHGQLPLANLHAIAEQARDRLRSSDEVTSVEIGGVPQVEVHVELDRQATERYGVSRAQVARSIRSSSIDIPAGSLETSASDFIVRFSDRKLRGHEFEDIVVLATPEGRVVRLGQVATVRDGYADTDQATFYNGEPAVTLTAYRVGSESPQSVSDGVQAMLAEMRTELPSNVGLSLWDDDSEMLRARINLLVKNGIGGFILVLIVLALFLDLRLAFWVGLGIPISFTGVFMLMPAMGVSVNMISLFALLITLGMVVDDAIIVGENAFDKMNAGMERMPAAIKGAQEMAVPVSFAILTTIAAFSPMFFVPGTMGKIFKILPVMVVGVLIFSLIESFFILPAHMGHGTKRTPRGFLLLVKRGQGRIAAGLEWFISHVYRPGLGKILDFRYVAASVAIALFFVAVGLVASGWVPRSFMPDMEGNVVTATGRLPYGVPISTTAEVQRALEASATAAIARHGGKGIQRGMISRLGSASSGGGPGGPTGFAGSHLVQVQIELVESAAREFTAKEFEGSWTELTPRMPGVEALTFSSSIGPSSGAAIDLQLSHRDETVLAAASAELADGLRGYTDLTNIENTYASGKPQLEFELRPSALTLGLTASDVAGQVRGAFFGAEALRDQRGRNEMKAMVRLPEDQRTSLTDIERLRILTPSGNWVPLSYVADYTLGRAATAIDREDGQRAVNVRAEKKAGVASANPTLEALRKDVVPALKKKYPALTMEEVGQQREQSDAFGALGLNFIAAMFVIYALLAVPFKSYTQPLVVMAAIPFGFVGAVGGHIFMGYGLSLISAMGIVALSGVVVNDSLVLMDATNRYRAEGASAREAIIRGGMRRFRPILLTSLTTFFGLLPMMFETDVQARFLIPMAISLGFGVLSATVLILLLVPAIYMILEDVRAVVGKVATFVLGPPAEPMPAK
jgi:multidrug efflux pump subunit AcrB